MTNWFILVFLILFGVGGNTSESNKFPSFIEGNTKTVFLRKTIEYTQVEFKGLNNEILTQIDQFVKQHLNTSVDLRGYLIKKLLENIGKLMKLGQKIESLIETEVTHKIVINFAETINSVFSSFRHITQRDTNTAQFSSFKSIGKNDDYIDTSSIIGCSSEVEFNKRKVGCLKRFLNLVKHPVTDYLGSDLIFPMLKLIDLPISKISAQDKLELGRLMGIDNTVNLVEFLRTKLLEPSEAYLNEKEKIEYLKQAALTPDQELNIQESTFLPTLIFTTPPPVTTVQSDMPNVEKNQIDKDLLNEIVENENDIISLKNELENYKSSISTLLTNYNNMQLNKWNELNQKFSILNEENLGNEKGITNDLDHVNELRKIEELMTGLMSPMSTSVGISNNVWDKQLFKSNDEKFLQKITYLTSESNLIEILPIPLCVNHICSYTVKPGFLYESTEMLPLEKCQQKTNIVFCDIVKMEKICKKAKCDVTHSLPHTREILLYGTKLFLYPLDTINVLGHKFESNVSYIIQSEVNVTFTFNEREYVLLGNELIIGLDIEYIGKNVSHNWEYYLHVYKKYIIIIASSLSTMIGLVSSVYLCKKKFDSSRSTRSVRINRTRVVFNRTPTNRTS